ncbi:MAG TPA: CopD family protein [Stellaceae bacterium]|nr:CopD family protein [Stellaceae bacterium]
MGPTPAVVSIALIVHILSVVVWVGGMFFALIVLRPASGPLEPGPRLELWARTLSRFFAWVIAAIVAILASGYAMVFSQFGGFAGLPIYVNAMMGLGLAMMLLFFHIYFAPFRRLRIAVSRRDYAAAGRQLGQIRWLVTAGLTLGLVTIAIASGGPYWG